MQHIVKLKGGVKLLQIYTLIPFKKYIHRLVPPTGEVLTEERGQVRPGDAAEVRE